MPAAARNMPDLVVVLRLNFAKDGSLGQPPQVVDSSANPRFVTAAESAIKAPMAGRTMELFSERRVRPGGGAIDDGDVVN